MRKTGICMLLMAALLVPSVVLAAEPGSTVAAPTSEQELPNHTDSLSRGEFAALFNEASGLYTTIYSPFTDLAEEHPYYYEILAAHHQGYFQGYPDHTAQADEPVSRIEAAALISRLTELPMPADGPVFMDQADIPPWARQSVQQVYAAGYLSLDDETGGFAPHKLISHAEATAIAERLADSQPRPHQEEITVAASFDGYELTGRLVLPANGKVDKLVIYVNGSGPNTYENHRQNGALRFRYHDMLAKAFADIDTAYFSYNTRGVTISEDAPYYEIELPAYETYIPTIQAQDIADLVKALKTREDLANAKVYLLGWSEGCIISPLALLETDLEVDGLLLCGYPNDNMRGILEWQQGGARTLFQYVNYFTAARDDCVTEEEFTTDVNGIRASLMPTIAFSDLDLNENGVIDAGDFQIMLKPDFDRLLAAIDADDYDWIRENYMELTPAWFRDHFALGATEDMLVQLDLPIYIFHGEMDLSCPVAGVHAVQERFAALGKENLTAFTFPGHDHDLNFTSWLVSKQLSQGIAALLDTVNNL